MPGVAAGLDEPTVTHVTVTPILTANRTLDGDFVGTVNLELDVVVGMLPLVSVELSYGDPYHWIPYAYPVTTFGVQRVFWRAVESSPWTGELCTHEGSVLIVGWRLIVDEPVNADGTSVFRCGSTVPVKIELATVYGLPVAGANVRFWVTKEDDSVTGTAVEPEWYETATTGDLFKESSNGRYSYNWSTKDLTPGTYLIHFGLDDEVDRTIRVSLR